MKPSTDDKVNSQTNLPQTIPKKKKKRKKKKKKQIEIGFAVHTDSIYGITIRTQRRYRRP